MNTTRYTPQVLAASAAVLAIFGVAVPAQAEDKARVEIYGFAQMDAI